MAYKAYPWKNQLYSPIHPTLLKTVSAYFTNIVSVGSLQNKYLEYVLFEFQSKNE